MQLSQIPTQVPLPFAANGTKNAIPEASQIGVTPGAASLNDGFPPLTFTPLAAGGVPPSGADFNGILNLLSQNTQWQNAGGFFPYSASFSASIGGYPKTALLAKASGLGFWLNLNDNNTTNPDTGGAGWIALDPWAIQAGQYATAKDTGAANAYAIALTPTPAALTPGMMVSIQSVANTNTGAATLAVNGLSVLPILLGKGKALIGGELVAGYGALLRLNYAGTAWELIWTGAGEFVPPATQSNAAVQLSQVTADVDTIADLRSQSLPVDTLTVLGYYAIGDGGGGVYYYDSADTTSADNGGTIIVDTSGRRWHLVHDKIVTVENFGAVGNGTTDDTAAIQNAINWANNTSSKIGKSIGFIHTDYLFSSTIVVYNRVRLVNLVNGSPVTFTTSMASSTGFQFLATNSITYYVDFFSGSFVILNTNTTNTSCGVFLGGTTSTEGECVQAVFRDLAIEGFSCSIRYGFNAYLIDFINCGFYGYVGSSPTGMVQVVANVSNTGERLTFNNCNFANTYGYVISAGLEFYFYSCSFDYLNVGSGSGIIINGGGSTGTYHFSGCHFEWDDPTSLLFVLSDNTQTLTVENCGIFYTGSSACEGVCFIGGNDVQVTFKGNSYYFAETMNYIFGFYSTTTNANVDSDDPSMVTQLGAATFGTWFSGAPVSGILSTPNSTTGNFAANTLSVQGQALVAPATQSNAAVQAGQLSSAPSVFASAASQGTETISGTSGTFTAPCNGKLVILAYGAQSVSPTTTTLTISASISGLNTIGSIGVYLLSTTLAELPMQSGESTTLTVTQYASSSCSQSCSLVSFFVPTP